MFHFDNYLEISDSLSKELEIKRETGNFTSITNITHTFIAD